MLSQIHGGGRVGVFVAGLNIFEVCFLEVALKIFCSIKYNLFLQLMDS